MVDAALQETIAHRFPRLMAAGVDYNDAQAVLGGIALDTKSEGEALCADTGDFAGYCSPEGADLLKSARTEGVAATATFIAGFAVVVGGFAIAVSALLDDDENAVEVGVGPTGVVVRGRF